MKGDRRWFRLLPGDLVSWRSDDGHVPGVVLEVYPANIYDKEACSIMVDGCMYTIESKYLTQITKAPD